MPDLNLTQPLRTDNIPVRIEVLACPECGIFYKVRDRHYHLTDDGSMHRMVRAIYILEATGDA